MTFIDPTDSQMDSIRMRAVPGETPALLVGPQTSPERWELVRELLNELSKRLDKIQQELLVKDGLYSYRQRLMTNIDGLAAELRRMNERLERIEATTNVMQMQLEGRATVGQIAELAAELRRMNERLEGMKLKRKKKRK